MGNITFLNPEFFWLFLLIPMAIVWLVLKRNQQSATLKISSIKGFKSSESLLAKLKPYLSVLRLVALSSLIVAMARQKG
jgi:Ca-activated chloride channel family protein